MKRSALLLVGIYAACALAQAALAVYALPSWIAIVPAIGAIVLGMAGYQLFKSVTKMFHKL